MVESSGGNGLLKITEWYLILEHQSRLNKPEKLGDGGRKVEKKKKVENDESSLPPLLSSNLGA